MGNCCNNKPKEEEDKSNEMKDGIFPKIDNMDEEDEKENDIGKEIKKTLYNFSTNYYQQDSMDSDFVNSEQKKKWRNF